MDGLEVVESSRRMPTETGDKVPQTNTSDKVVSSGEKMLNAVADNFGNILNLASNIVEIEKMKVQSDAVLAKMREDRAMLLAEAEAYATKKNADTNNIVEKMNIIRGMMNDFYQQSNAPITSEDFRAIITEVVNQMGRIENGN